MKPVPMRTPRRAGALSVCAIVAAVAIGAPEAGAVVPGKNGRIAYMGLTDLGIFSVDPDGDRRRRLSNGFDVGPSWSPNGKRIAFVDAVQGDIWKMRANGDDKRRLTRNGSSFEPSWSPNGKRIVFVKGGGGDPEIFTMRSDGSGRSRVTDNGADDFDPDWSPNGRRIVFARSRHSSPPDLFKVDPDGSDEERITGTQNRYEVTPAWSPDGRRIAFAGGRESDDEEIFTIGTDGRRRRQITANDQVDADPAWSPNGNQIAFFSRESVWRMESDGGRARRVARDGAWPDWQAR
ncbi:MAG: hypothetical protein R2718_03685 [Solirubrobacterales bacterium]